MGLRALRLARLRPSSTSNLSLSLGLSWGCVAPPSRAYPTPRRVFYSVDSEDTDAQAARKEALVWPEAPTTRHHDLQSFLSYAKKHELSPTTTVYVGTLFEYTVALALVKYGFHLKRIGGASDYGTDLLGIWTLPTTSQCFRVLVQCKLGGTRVSPHYVRELEGAFAGAPAGWRAPSTVIGLLAAEKEATKGVRDALSRSQWPMVYVRCSRDGAVGQILWNRAATHAGLEGYGVTARHRGVEPQAPPGGDTTAPEEEHDNTELVLTKNGRILPLLMEE